MFEEFFYEDCNPIFEQNRENFEHDRRYQPRIVVDDEEEGISDDDDM